jgi:hypothetical protein
MIQVVAVAVIEPYILDVTFSDGTRRRVDVEPILWGPLFEPVHDPAYFRKARFDPDMGTVAWPNGADIAPEYLYEHGVVVSDLASV